MSGPSHVVQRTGGQVGVAAGTRAVTRLHEQVGCRAGIPVRHRRTGVECRRRVQLQMMAAAQAERQASEIGIDVGAIPHQRGRIAVARLADCRLLALRGRHFRPGHAQRFLVDKLIEGAQIGHAAIAESDAIFIDDRYETESVTDFVQHDAQQVGHVTAAVIVTRQLVIESVVEIAAAEASGRAVHGAAEGRGDVVPIALVRTRQRVRECGRIEQATAGCARKTTEHVRRARGAEHTCGAAAAERIKRGLDDDRHAARDQRAPELRGLVEHVEARLAKRDSIVAADRREWGRVVETFTGSVHHDDRQRGRDGRRRSEPGTDGEQRDRRYDCAQAFQGCFFRAGGQFVP